MPNSKYTDGFKTKGTLPKIDKRFYDTIWGEASGGSPQEVAAVVSVFLNRARDEGYEKALKGSSAYNKKSPQYKKASLNIMNPLEKVLYQRNKEIVDTLISDPSLIAPFTHMENVKVYGEPSWAKGMKGTDIGRQRFYTEE